LDKFFPANTCLLQATRPKFQKKADIRILLKHARCATQRMKLISLNIHFYQVNALAGFQVIIQGYDIDGHGIARISFRHVRPVIDVQFI
jgi:hypothetical protein